MIKVLVVDDSEVTRRLLSFILNSDPVLQVVDTAADGEEAVRLVERLRPDVVTMDLNMPRMDGFEATRRIMEATPVPIVIVSASHNLEEVNRTFLAMGSGALAVVDKPMGPDDPLYEARARELRTTVRLMSEVRVVGRRYSLGAKTPGRPPRAREEEPVPRVVGIGSSTGGPQTLEGILRFLPNNFELPILVVQHIAAGFTRGLAAWLGSVTGLDVRVATNDEALAPGRCYLAPTGFHMGVNRERKIFLSSDPPKDGLRPSVDFLFHSLAAVYGERAAGVVLTGMGRDGAAGLKALYDKGAITITQDQESSIIFGMPRAAVNLGAARHVLPPDKIAAKLMDMARRAEARPGGSVAGAPDRGQGDPT